VYFSHSLPESNLCTPSTSGSNVTPIRKSKRLVSSKQTPTIPLPNMFLEPITERAKDSFTIPVQKKKIKVEHMKFNWVNGNKVDFEVNIPDYDYVSQQDYVLTPFEYFDKFFSEDLFQHIKEQTNLYTFQKEAKAINITDDDLKDFLSIELWMGVAKLPAYTDYWSHLMGYEKVNKIMSLKKYQKILKSIHFNNNEEYNPNERFYKVQPLLDIKRRNCLRQEQGKQFSVDEMMIPYKGKKAGSRRQYIKSKPKKWGFKFFVRSGINGMVYDFFPYSGETTFDKFTFSDYENKYFGLGPKVILALANTIPNKSLSVIFFDNFFTTPELIYHLRKNYGILSLGTVQENRLRNCPLLKEKELKKKGRGSYSYKCDKKKKVLAVKWLDNKPVCLASSFVSLHPINTVKRYSKVTKSYVDVPLPKIVEQYNTHMGGVDLADMLVALYRIELKTHKWYMAVFSQLLDICVNNAWLLYRQDCHQYKHQKVMRLKEFRINIAIALNERNRPSKAGRKSAKNNSTENVKKVIRTIIPRPIDDVKFDKYDHFLVRTTKGRCRYCKKGQTIYICTKCNTRLCTVKKRNCYNDFHTKK